MSTDTSPAKEETLAVFRGPVVERIFDRPRLAMESSLTKALLQALARGDLVPRRVAERETSMTQAVAYATLRLEGRVVCLQRRFGSRDELRGRRTIVFGGHVNAGERNGLEGLRRCLLRELNEEFDLRVEKTRFVGVLADPTSQVGRQHLGFMFEAEIKTEQLLDRALDNHEYVPLPGGLFVADVDTLLLMDREEFDPWSRLVLASYARAGDVGN